MNAFANFDFFDKQTGAPVSETAETEAKAREFDELFNNFVALPSAASVQKISEESLKPATDSGILPAMDGALLKNNLATAPNSQSFPNVETATERETLPAEKNAPSVLIPETFNHHSANETTFAPEKKLSTEKILPPELKIKSESFEQTFAPADEAEQTKAFEPNFSRETSAPSSSSLDSESSPLTKNVVAPIDQAPELQVENSPALEVLTQTKASEKAFSPDPNAPTMKTAPAASQAMPTPIASFENQADLPTSEFKTVPAIESNGNAENSPEKEMPGALESSWQNVKQAVVLEEISFQTTAPVKPAAPTENFIRPAANDSAPEPFADLTPNENSPQTPQENFVSDESQSFARPAIKLAAPDENVYQANVQTKVVVENLTTKSGTVSADKLEIQIDKTVSAVENEPPRDLKNSMPELKSAPEKIAASVPADASEFIRFKNSPDFKFVKSESPQEHITTGKKDFFAAPGDVTNEKGVAPETQAPSNATEKNPALSEAPENTTFSAANFSSSLFQENAPLKVSPANEVNAHPAVQAAVKIPNVPIFSNVRATIVVSEPSPEIVGTPQSSVFETTFEKTNLPEFKAASSAFESPVLPKPDTFSPMPEDGETVKSAAPSLSENIISSAVNIRPASFANVLALETSAPAPIFEAPILSAVGAEKASLTFENQTRPAANESRLPAAFNAIAESQTPKSDRESHGETQPPVPNLQPPGRFKRVLLSQVSPKLEVFTPSTIPPKFRNHIHFTNQATGHVGDILSSTSPVVAADTAPAVTPLVAADTAPMATSLIAADTAPAPAADTAPVVAASAADTKKHLSEAFPQIFQTGAGASESPKNIENSPRVAPAADLKVERNPSNVQETSSLKSAISATETAGVKIEKAPEKSFDAFDSTENLAANFFDKLTMNAGKELKNTEVKASRFVESAAVFEQIEEPLLRAALLDRKTDEPDILKLRLRPAELGAVEIRLEKTEAGTINVHLQTETDAARHSLAESVEQLKSALQNSGWQVERMEVSAQQLSSNNGGDAREQQSRQSSAESRTREAQTSFGGSADEPDDSRQNQSNRLLSVRA